MTKSGEFFFSFSRFAFQSFLFFNFCEWFIFCALGLPEEFMYKYTLYFFTFILLCGGGDGGLKRGGGKGARSIFCIRWNFVWNLFQNAFETSIASVWVCLKFFLFGIHPRHNPRHHSSSFIYVIILITILTSILFHPHYPHYPHTHRHPYHYFSSYSSPNLEYIHHYYHYHHHCISLQRIARKKEPGGKVIFAFRVLM